MVISFSLLQSADVSGFQISTNPEAGTEGSPCHDAVVYTETFKDADKISWSSVEKVQHEDNVGHLSESETSAQ